MPRKEVVAASREMVERSYDCLEILRHTGVWMTAWAVSQELELPTGRQTRNSLERLVTLGDVEAVDAVANQGYGRHYRALAETLVLR